MMLSIVQLLFIQVVLSANINCTNNEIVKRGCKPKICTINYPVIKAANWTEIECCGECTAEQCCSPEKWWLTVPVLVTYIMIIVAYLYITRPDSKFSQGWMNSAQRSVIVLEGVNAADSNDGD